MRIGRLRQKVTIQRKVRASPDRFAEGDPDESWEDFLTGVSAEWTTLQGDSLFIAQQHRPEVKGVWRIRWRSTVTAEMRVVHGGLHYDILFVPPRDRYGLQWSMDLECTQGVSEG